MSINSTRNQLAEKLQDKEYRDAFVSQGIFSRLPLKIRALREQRRLSQKQLGEKTDVAQAWVSKLEDPNYGKLTLSTLLRLASAFDVGLEVDFVPFSKVLDGALSLSQESFKVASFAEDRGLSCKSEPDAAPKKLAIMTTRELHYRTVLDARVGTHYGTRPVQASRQVLKRFCVAPPLLLRQHSCGGASRNLILRQREAA